MNLCVSGQPRLHRKALFKKKLHTRIDKNISQVWWLMLPLIPEFRNWAIAMPKFKASLGYTMNSRID